MWNNSNTVMSLVTIKQNYHSDYSESKLLSTFSPTLSGECKLTFTKTTSEVAASLYLCLRFKGNHFFRFCNFMRTILASSMTNAGSTSDRNGSEINCILSNILFVIAAEILEDAAVNFLD